MGSVIPFALRAAHKTSGDVGEHSICRQNAADCLRNSAEPPGDIFDKIVARIRVARCYMLCHTQLSAGLGSGVNVSAIRQNVAFEHSPTRYAALAPRIFAARRSQTIASAPSQMTSILASASFLIGRIQPSATAGNGRERTHRSDPAGRRHAPKSGSDRNGEDRSKPLSSTVQS